MNVVLIFSLIRFIDCYSFFRPIICKLLMYILQLYLNKHDEPIKRKMSVKVLISQLICRSQGELCYSWQNKNF